MTLEPLLWLHCSISGRCLLEYIIGTKSESHTVDYDPFIESQLASTQLTLGPYAVHVWSRNTPESGPNETCVVHRVGVPLLLKLTEVPLLL